jgi:hypothetical protein
MTNRWFLLSALSVIVIMFAIGWLLLSRRVAYFALERRLRIEVDGVPVEGGDSRQQIFRNRNQKGRRQKTLLSIVLRRRRRLYRGHWQRLGLPSMGCPPFSFLVSDAHLSALRALSRR